MTVEPDPVPDCGNVTLMGSDSTGQEHLGHGKIEVDPFRSCCSPQRHTQDRKNPKGGCCQLEQERKPNCACDHEGDVGSMASGPKLTMTLIWSHSYTRSSQVVNRESR